MRAHRIVKPHSPAELCEVPTPEPGPGQVLVKVGGSGLCHSDLHLMHFPSAGESAFTIGHETAGWVEQVGAGVTGLEVGQPIIVHGAWGCGYCRRCQADLDQYCENQNVMGKCGSGLGTDGGMAEYLLVPAARHVIPLGDLDPRVWAPLDDAVLTPYHALKRLIPFCTPDNWAMVIGVGGLGHAAIQLFKELTGARVIAVDIADDKLALATDLGADAVVRGDAEDAAAQVRDATGGQGVAAVMDCVGIDSTMALAAASVHSISHIVIVGVGMGTFPLNVLSVPWETSISTTVWGTATELRELIAMASTGRLHLHVEQIPLELVGAAYERLEAGKILGRAVALPHG